MTPSLDQPIPSGPLGMEEASAEERPVAGRFRYGPEHGWPRNQRMLKAEVCKLLTKI